MLTSLRISRDPWWSCTIVLQVFYSDGRPYRPLAQVVPPLVRGLGVEEFADDEPGLSGLTRWLVAAAAAGRPLPMCLASCR
jgi:hypothetical protein